MRSASLAVVVPALDEATRIGGCLESLARQAASVEVFVSDNASADGTADVARSYEDRLELSVRTISRLPASPHFVSAAQWALAASDAPVFALLAGDDAWEEGFATAALDELDRRPEVDVVYPAFRWEGGEVTRLLEPTSFTNGRPAVRQLRALMLDDHRELGNLVYGVYRRAAFSGLIEEWERGGDAFGCDFAAAWAVLGRHRVVACPGAVGRRRERPGADLLERVGMSRPAIRGPVGHVRAYLVLNLRINRALSDALRLVRSAGWTPAPWQVQLLRAPQWLLGSWRHVASALGGRR